MNDSYIDIIKTSKDLLRQALTQGYFTLPNSNEIKELTVNQILSLARAVVKDGLNLETESLVSESSNLPSDLFSNEATASIIKEEIKRLKPKSENNVSLNFLDQEIDLT